MDISHKFALDILVFIF